MKHKKTNYATNRGGQRRRAQWLVSSWRNRRCFTVFEPVVGKYLGSATGSAPFSAVSERETLPDSRLLHNSGGLKSHPTPEEGPGEPVGSLHLFLTQRLFTPP
ncbi:hypothetical protein cypCar_00048401, partial [Cyprinus carpio]